MAETEAHARLPVFPVRNTILLPYIFAPFSAGRQTSKAALDAAIASEDKELLVVAQRDASVEHPSYEDLYPIGTRAVIKRMARSEETIEVLLQGVERAELTALDQDDPYLQGTVRDWPLPQETDPETDALQRELVSLSGELQQLVKTPSGFDINQVVEQVTSPMHLTFVLASLIDLSVEKAQSLLKMERVADAMRQLHADMTHELQVLQLRKEIAGQAESEMTQQQREHMLRQQMRTIQQELGESGGEQEELNALRSQLDEAELPEAAEREGNKVLNRLQQMSSASPDYQLFRTYLETLLDLPWNTTTEDHLDLNHAREVLNADHYGLDEIKQRILEHLAVIKLNPGAKSPILCFVGPPGVGKTSLGQSIARALGRKFERFSLGGLHDEAELRGHRRTYIGAMPGRILQALRRVSVRNPVLMLDEVDKLGRDFRGDPAAALLEILDPAQNFEFRDNYLDLPFDLSKVFFILTANTLDTIPAPLLDRVETIRLAGYTLEEKMEIAKRYLMDRQREQAGLNAEQLGLPDETLRQVIERYTREAGVRELERMLGRVARKVALNVALEETEATQVGPEDLPEYLGSERFSPETAREALPPGVATGLAWTETGGDVLYVEAIRLPRSEDLTLTGQLGKVMQESARASYSYILSRVEDWGLEPPPGGLHIHVPTGAIPKDGPSAGVTMSTCIASLVLGQAARKDTAMTGEITLSGLVLPVGGIKEKLLAARRAGIKRVILPKENEKDLRELPEDVRHDLTLVFAAHIEEVLRAAIPDFPATPLEATA